jgi:acyl-CoA reductase-like NAD-dependent aldehyde dehydrogenase
MNARGEITKTWKLFIGGGYPRSESGKVFPVASGVRRRGAAVAYAAQASRKDLRDAVEAARAAQERWAASSAYLRGQIIYRLAEVLEGRSTELVDAIMHGGATRAAAAREVAHSIDRVVCMAGWSDKIESVTCGRNQVAGSFHCFSQLEPVGVVAIVAPEEPSLLGILSLMLPAMTVGCSVVVLASERAPLPALVVAECAPSADIPAGVLNLLTGSRKELLGTLAAHRDVDAIVASAAGDAARTLQVGVAENFKRVRIVRPGVEFVGASGLGTDHDWCGPHAFGGVTEVKTVWHTLGS